MAQIDRLVRLLTKALALLGGVILLALVATTTLSIVGRSLNSIGHSEIVATYLPFLAAPLQWFRPITGDFELVEAGVAFAIMAFLPWCQIEQGHAKVEVLTGFLPATANRWLALLWEAVFCAAYLLIAWRLIVGTNDKLRYGETSFMLQFPVWWGYATVSAAAVLACIVAIWSFILHAREAAGHRHIRAATSRVH